MNCNCWADLVFRSGGGVRGAILAPGCAADLSGATLNQFLIQAAVKEADRIIDRELTVQITAEDAALFIRMLDNPRPPNEAMKRAYERYKTKVRNGTLRYRAGSDT